MARLLTALIASAMLLGAASAMSTIDGGKAYCGGDMMIMVNGPALALWSDTTDSTGSMCKRLYKYSFDTQMGVSNVTLNELDSYSCFTSEGRVSWMTYNSANDEFWAVVYDSSSKRVHFTPGGCAAAPASNSQLAAGRYCSADVSIVTRNRHALYMSNFSGQPCWLATYLDFQDTGNDWYRYTASSCPVGIPTVSRYIFNPNNNEWALGVSTGGEVSKQMFTLTSTCDASARPAPVVGKPYCVASTAAGTLAGAVMTATNSTHFLLMVSVSNTQTCRAEGWYTGMGDSVTLSSQGFQCTSGQLQLSKVNFYGVNDSWAFVDGAGNRVVAETCANTAPELPSGTYCGGENAKMVVGKGMATIFSDANDHIKACTTTFAVAYAANAFDLTAIQSTCVNPASSLKMTRKNDKLYVTFERSAGSDGYAFSTAACTVTPAAVPSNSYCTHVGGAHARMIVDGERMVAVMNNSWIGSAGPCAMIGHMTHRSGDVSYHIDASACHSSINVPQITLSHITFANGQLTFDTTNSTKTTTATTMTCAAPATPPMAQTSYCPVMSNGGKQPSNKMYVYGEHLAVAHFDDKCIDMTKIDRRVGDRVYITRTVTGCTGENASPQIKYFDVLADGALHAYDLDSRISAHDSNAACSPTFAPVAPTPNVWCGVTSGNGTRTKFSMSSINDFMFTMVIEPTSGDICVMRGYSVYYSNGIGFQDINVDTPECNNKFVARIAKVGNNLNVTYVTRDGGDDTYSSAILSTSTCASWERGLASGMYCSNAIMPTVGSISDSTHNVSVAGRYITWSAGSTTMVANISAVSGMNVTYNRAWTTSGGSWSNTMPTTTINKVGTSGLSLTTATLTMAANREQCNTPVWFPTMPQLLASTDVAGVGKVYGAFGTGGVNSGDGTITAGSLALTWKGAATTRADWCTLRATYVASFGQMTVTPATSTSCGYIKNVEYTAGLATVKFVLVNNGVSYSVDMARTNCGATPSGLQAGVYVGIMPGVQTSFMCDDQYLTLNGVFGNLTANSNRTMTLMYTARSMNPDVIAAGPSNNVYNKYNIQGLESTFMQCQVCEGVTMPAMALEGTYCGTSPVSKKNATLVQLPNGKIWMMYYVPAGTSATSTAQMCHLVGSMGFNGKTGNGVISFDDMSNECDFQSNYLKIKPTSVTIDNKTFKITMNANYYSAPNAAAQAVSMTFDAQGCGDRLSATYKNVLAPMPQGSYSNMGADTMAKMHVIGDEYAIWISKGGNGGFGGGMYTVPRKVASTEDVRKITFKSMTATGGILNDPLRNISVRDTTVQVLASTSGGYVTSPMAFEGESAVQRQIAHNAAKAAAAKAEERKKIGIIIGVAVAVVVVIAIIAVVVIRSRSSGHRAPPSQPGEQDYRPMNGV